MDILQGSYNNDAPLIDPNDDEFGYKELAKKIADGISAYKNPQGFVIAINGEWGSGKTSLINFITSYLSKNNLVIIKFNPWYFSDREDLTRQFFRQFGIKLSKTVKYAATFTKILGGFVTELGNVKESYDGLMDAFQGSFDPDMKDIHTLKEELSDFLKKQQKSLIIIDDIDRLSSDEIKELFLVIKGLADFPNVIYLLSFDKAVVSRMLNDVQNAPGEKYLSKIIQTEFMLPPINPLHLENYFYKKIGNAMGLQESELFDKKMFHKFWNETLYYIISTPRDICRLSNSLALLYPSLHEEVNPLDFILLEIIRLFLPDLFDFIVKNRNLLIGYPDPESFKSPEFNHNWFTFYKEDPHKHQSTKLLTYFLFPRSDPEKTDISLNRIVEKKKLRIFCPDHFPLYFGMQFPDYRIDEREVKDILNSSSDEELLQKINEIISKPIFGYDQFDYFVQKINELVYESIIPEKASIIVSALFKVADPYIQKRLSEYPHQSPYEILHIEYLVCALVSNIDSTLRKETLKSAIETGKSLYQSVDIVHLLLIEKNNCEIVKLQINENPLLSSDDIIELKQSILQILRMKSNNLSFFSIPNIHFVLLIWYDWEEKKQICKDWAHRIIEYPGGVLFLIRSFCSIRHSWDSVQGGSAEYYYDLSDMEKFIDPVLIQEKYQDTRSDNQKVFPDDEVSKIATELFLEALSSEERKSKMWRVSQFQR